uniref:SFRICE_001921 n=1 Tax=Spodoptera frugiperda TaxID=7108 RepID=A0A2H1W2B3_SPOFR
MQVEKLITERGATILVVAGEHFYKQKVRGPRTRWHCSKKTRMKCKAAITTVGDTVVRTYLHHSHDEYGNLAPPPPPSENDHVKQRHSDVGRKRRPFLQGEDFWLKNKMAVCLQETLQV